MKLSIVTISYNQQRYLRECLNSVIEQKRDNVEYIVVDPGSTDGSREILSEYSRHIDCTILDPDKGPADGLSKGFSRATGDVFYYLNSDDIVFEDAFVQAMEYFENNSELDVLIGHGMFLDEEARPIRKIWSDPISRMRLAFGGGIVVQPATFFRRSIYEAVGGFNVENRSNWDGELITDFFLEGANFEIVDRLWGGYRLHGGSITSSAKLREQIAGWSDRKKEKLGFRIPAHLDQLISKYYQVERTLRHPSNIYARMVHGKVFGGSK